MDLTPVMMQVIWDQLNFLESPIEVQAEGFSLQRIILPSDKVGLAWKLH